GRAFPLLAPRVLDPPAGPAWAGVRADERPVILGPGALQAQLVQLDDQVGKPLHERPRGFRDRGAPDRRGSSVDRERACRRVVSGDLGRILAAPGFGVGVGQVEQLVDIADHAPAQPGGLLGTGNVASRGGVEKPPSIPADIRGISISLRKRSQLSCESWIATIVQPSADGPAAWKSWPSGRLPSLGWTAAIDAS